ncbi:MAG: Unknown protein [uncultured Sulfurovum sp.]|uniref:Uncharacterized protein n=1 Tax=uncultured Sulfurovum sp. TaxID=269237 RepID=A0A6S6SG84_9BACT|nr:MAG: Unknown protein [uncultured Sulfurovum sp.]
MAKGDGTQKNMISMLYEEEREMIPQEYASLTEKKRKNVMNADMFRKNLFNAGARGTRTLYKKPKQVWTGRGGEIVSVSHSLHQKHADVLSLIYSEGFKKSTSSADGSYDIYISLYAIAKAMGYKHPRSGGEKVKAYINDLRWTDFIITAPNGEILRTTILDDCLYSEEMDSYVIRIKGRNAKILSHSTGIEMEKLLNRKIVNIPDKLSKLKAMIRFIISNKAQKLHGYTLDHFFVKFGVGQTGAIESRNNQKSLFRKQLNENKPLLDQFNLRWEKTEDKIYYDSQLEDINFILPLKKDKIVFEMEKIDNPYGQYIGKKIKIEDVIYEILEINNSSKDGGVDVKLENTHSKERGISKNASIENMKALLI